jgi:predicted nucleic acid-binding protein
MHSVPKSSHQISRDPDDDKFIEYALSAGVNVIVSGDQDLLIISEFNKIDIVTPAVFVKKYLK